MNTDAPKLYTEQDIEESLTSSRFLAATHVYSMNKIPLGEVMVRAVAGPPYLPSRFANQSRTYAQLIDEVAERIARGKIEVPARLAVEYPEVYADYAGPSWWSRQPYLGSSAFRFSELRSPEARKKAFALHRTSFTESDISEISKDERMLACIDAYGKNLTTYRIAAKLMYGDDDSSVPLDLSFSAFHALVLEMVNRIKRDEIKIPADFEQKFSGIYSTRDTSSESQKQ